MRYGTGLVVTALAAALSGCSDDNTKTWIVVDLQTPQGRHSQMSFNNPSVPAMTLAECEQSLEVAIPTLMQSIESQPETKGSRFVSAKCVASAEDPIKPKA